MGKQQKHNGYKNYDTWNVVLWIGNDEGLYRQARSFMRGYHGRSPYADFISDAGLDGQKTSDGVAWAGRSLGYGELNRMMREL